MNAPAPGLAIVITTVESVADAEKLGRELVEQKLVACAQIDGPISSIYSWQNKLEQASEYRLMLKTSMDRWPDVQSYLDRAHSYDEPEVMLVPIAGASAGYAQWVFEQTRVGEVGP